MKILLIEDEPLLLDNLYERFKNHGYIVDTAVDGEQAIYLALEYDYELIILDLGLPKLPGLVVLEKLREAGKTVPVLILTARNSWQERVEGLRSGADDYLGKPFHFEELLARVETLLKRHSVKPSSGNLSFKHVDNDKVITLDLEAKTLSEAEEIINLTATEFRLVRTFFQNPQQVFSKQNLLERISQEGDEKEENLIEVYIRRLRNYMGKESIKTLRGQGYRLTLTRYSEPSN